jgi:protein required for attachment to host cells
MTVTWIVLADRVHASIRRQRAPHGPFEHVEDIDHPEGRLHAAQLGSDRPGQTLDSSHHRPHALEPHETMEEHEARAFARTIAQRLTAACNARRFDALVLVAEPRFLGLLRGALDHPTQQRLRGEIRRRLIDASDTEIAQQLSKESLHVAG